MVKKRERLYVSEFPILDQLGLYASATKGDGNCLFRALSDQIHGDESHHSEIRQQVINYVEKNGDHFSAFVGEFGETFEQYVSRLRQDGVYGGDIELTGFADQYNKEVVVYLADSLYVIRPRESKKTDGSIHLAYHTWEHYSSVRKIGSTSGPVHIATPKSATVPISSENLATSEVPSWKIDVVLKSVPDASETKVIEMLREKDSDTVIEELLVEQYANEHHTNVNTEPSEASKDPPETPKKGTAPPPPPPPGVSRKEAAKQRRLEKKERIRQKKTKQNENNSVDGSKDTQEVLEAKIIHI